jgi:antitoxin component YwqK of YwqJK toxin-antitoxin module
MNLKCTKILKSGKQCSRNAQLNSEYCWQHLDHQLSIIPENNKFEISPTVYFKNIIELPPDIIKNILSDYIDYDQLIEITKYSKDFKVNPQRVQIEENIDLNNNLIKEIYIDDDLRKVEVFNKDNIKTIERHYKNGKLEGKQYKWYDNGQLNIEENDKNGELEGKQYSWYEDSKLKYEYNYVNGELEGKQYNWYNNGKLEYEENYKNGELEGKQYGWYNNDQNNFKNGKIEEFKNTKLYYEYNYKNGQKEGKQYRWYDTGQLNAEENYKNGEVEGKQYFYHKNGQLNTKKNIKMVRQKVNNILA